MVLVGVRLPGATRSILAASDQRWVAVAPEIVEELADWSPPVRVRARELDDGTRVVALTFQTVDRTVAAEGVVRPGGDPGQDLVFDAGDGDWFELPRDTPVRSGRYRLVFERLPDPRPNLPADPAEAGRGPEDG